MRSKYLLFLEKRQIIADELVFNGDGDLVLISELDQNIPIRLPDGTFIFPDGRPVGPNFLPGDILPGPGPRPVIRPPVRPRPTVNRPSALDGTVIGVDGTVLRFDGSIVRPDGTVITASGTIIRPDGSVERPDGTIFRPDGSVVRPNGSVLRPDGSIVRPNGNILRPDGSILRPVRRRDGSTVFVIIN